MFCPVLELAGRQSVDNTVDAQICVCVPLKTCYFSKISDLFDAANNCNDCLGCFIVTI